MCLYVYVYYVYMYVYVYVYVYVHVYVCVYGEIHGASTRHGLQLYALLLLLHALRVCVLRELFNSRSKLCRKLVIVPRQQLAHSFRNSRSAKSNNTAQNMKRENKQE